MSQIENVLISISSKLLDSHTADMETVILDALEDSRIALGVDRISCLPIDPTIRQGRHYESCGEGIPPVMNEVPTSVQLAYRHLIQQGEIIFSDDSIQLYELANQLQSETILSHVLVPISAMSKPWGLMACANFVSERPFNDEFIHSAKILGNIIASSIERLIHYERLKRSQQEVLARNRRIVDERERERRTIARDLHDDFGQRLASLGIEMAIATSLCDEGSQIAFKKCAQDLADITRDVQHLSRHLHPVVIERLGLHAAIKSHAKNIGGRTGLRLSVELDNSVVFDDETALHIYRIIQESLSNIVKHASAKSVWVKMHQIDTQQVELVVRDDGIGFNEQDLEMNSPSLGLKSMVERGELIGAQVDFKSNTKRTGASVVVSIPYTKDQ
ncbi:GAF domain-containing sensor histidine kinase [Vibrio sp. FNV 38]|nr:GAF domain-containing sensor histidine kinase [Vibrio sp. FNV 38]